MSVIQNAVSVAAGATNANLISGSAFEFARTRQVVSLGVIASATGSFVAITSGSDVVAEEFPPFEGAAFPVIPDQMYYNDVMEVGDRLRIQARNPTGGAIVFRFIVQVAPA